MRQETGARQQKTNVSLRPSPALQNKQLPDPVTLNQTRHLSSPVGQRATDDDINDMLRLLQCKKLIFTVGHSLLQLQS